MIFTIQDPKYGTIIYEESFWTGPKALSLCGVTGTKQKRNVFAWTQGDQVITATVKGNFFTGAKMVIGTDSVILVPYTKWYDYCLAILPMLLLFIWGNSPVLCGIVPIIGGGIGGFLIGVSICLSIWMIKRKKNFGIKLLLALGLFAATFFVLFLFALLYIFLIVSLA